MTIICAQCGTRNPSNATSCRRCRAVIANESVSTSTRRGSPTASVLGERWVIDGPLYGARDKSLFLGHDIDTQKPVVIKRLSEQLARDRSMRSQFFHEARILSQLNHTNLIRVIDVIETQQEPAMILEYFEGETLDNLLNRHGRLPVGVALEFAGQILDGLQDLHAQGIIHRQLTPASIQVRVRDNMASPVLVLADFGIAQVLPSTVESSGTLIGMRAGDVLSAVEPTMYSAPEMLTLDAQMASDLYALGVIFFRMLTGTLPLPKSRDRDEMVHDINETEPTKLRTYLHGASPVLESLIHALLQKDPAARPRDAALFMEMLLSVPEQQSETMLYIPGGEFLQGSEPGGDSRREEMPQRSVDLSPFFVDKTPITSAQFASFLSDTNHEMPKEWWTFNSPELHPTMPAVFVNWFDAKAYAQWAGKRLLTEAEWEKAARGTNGYLYPWGDEPPNVELSWYGDKTRPHAVGQFPRGASIYNVLDMSGNVFEWVQDWYDKSYYKQAPNVDPIGPEQGKKKVLKGGSFVHPDFALRCAVRGRYVPMERRANHSFRCAWSMD